MNAAPTGAVHGIRALSQLGYDLDFATTKITFPASTLLAATIAAFAARDAVAEAVVLSRALEAHTIFPPMSTAWGPSTTIVTLPAEPKLVAMISALAAYSQVTPTTVIGAAVTAYGVMYAGPMAAAARARRSIPLSPATRASGYRWSAAS